jgi:serine/threonine-protein kinase HipA
VSVAAEIRLWGRLSAPWPWRTGRTSPPFEFAPEFARSGIQPAPLRMPLSRGVYRFPELPRARSRTAGAAGRFSSRPLRQRPHRRLAGPPGRTPESFNAVERLCYYRRPRHGALEFHPARGPEAKEAQSSKSIGCAARFRSAAAAGRFCGPAFHRRRRRGAQPDPAGGNLRRRRPAKAVIAWNPKTNEVRSGQLAAPEGFEHWLRKFDGWSPTGTRSWTTRRVSGR